ncbi:hypothetical protein CKM354_000780200 [Cercospora kikuchii]|uniref:Nephrocystin 3-like N-terminal domain-containing protein n=1 Tax=Cercospora kikuchii TaxID=84275 RepID=A0A9P3CUK1_9PEZI|nr:uncharacterized protein CKM354_000780200 [Cercospora kikuchii]GIZ44608.1 hypothetical protein CKM354_000780200 [Cercospora kikuchii]
MEGLNVAQLFEQLEITDERATRDDAFLRGVKFLRSIQVPLENFKLALDLASPLTSLEPTTLTVCGVIRSVTAIAISLATADLDFAKQIGEMLEHMRYIDDCDTLGRRTKQPEIHEALVLVYVKVLEFYNVALNVLTRKGAGLLLKLLQEKERLPEIVQDFLKHADALGRLVTNATLEIAADIRDILTQFEIYQWLGRDKMDRQSEHHAQLRELRRADSDSAHAPNRRHSSPGEEACAFLLTDETFMQWYASPSVQHLAILAEMGCGKSVLVAFLIDELRRRNQNLLPNPKICYYYCRDDGTGQITSILSVLILQLLEQLPGMKLTFYEWYKKNSGTNPANDGSMLEEFLRMVIIPLDRPLYIIVDGLDECVQATKRTLVKLLKELARSNSRLKILLCSRPDHLLQLDATLKLHLLPLDRRDRLISKHIVNKQLWHLSGEVRELIAEHLFANACGSAIWIKMMVDLIELEGYTTLPLIQRSLRKMALPGPLSHLYDEVLSRCAVNAERREHITLALRILAAARRPLSIAELAFAVALGLAPSNITTVAALNEMVDEERTLTMIRPFITQIDHRDHKRRQIRLLHQSIKEYVVEKLDPRQNIASHATGRNASTELLVGQVAQHTEECVLNICVRYLLLDEVGTINLFSQRQCAIDALPQETDLFEDDIAGAVEYTKDCTWEQWEADMIRYDPAERGFGEFFAYATCHWVEHLGSIDAEHLPSLADIERLCSARFPFDPTLHDPLSIVSLYGSEAVLAGMLERPFVRERYHANTAMRAAEQVLRWSPPERAAVLTSRLRARLDGRGPGNLTSDARAFRQDLSIV